MVVKTPTNTGKYAWVSVRSLRRAAVLCLVFYALTLCLLVDVKPLWLDEVIQLSGTAGTSWRDVLRHVMENAGGAPFGYLGQHWLISLAGCSVRTARLPSVLAGVGTLGALLLVCKRLALRRSTGVLAACLWIVCPLALRYSLEARPYMQAMLFAMFAVLVQIKLRETCTTVWAVVLAACLGAAVYSQPYALFGPLGFAVCSVWQQRDRKYAILTFGAHALVALCFLPWLLAAHAYWVNAIARNHGKFEWTLSLAVALCRECVGDGYFAAVPALLLAAYGAHEAAKQPRRDPRMQLAAAIISSVALALIADARFNYFFAIRQVIYMTPFLLLIVADGAILLWRQYRGLAAILVFAFIGASIVKDYRHITDHNEDWNRLSEVLMQAAEGGCILLPAGDDAATYMVFRPRISRHLCDSTAAARIVMPVHSYTDPRAVRQAGEMLSAMGLKHVSTERAGFGRVEVFARR